jgi:hypothetical protein
LPPLPSLHELVFLTHPVLYRNPNGEIRVDLFVPQGVATITYDTQSVPATTTTLPNVNVMIVPAIVTVSLTGMTGTPTAIHLHGSAVAGSSAPALVWLCQSGNCPAALSVPNAGSVYSFPNFGTSYSVTFTNVALPLALVAAGSTYLNVHTLANPSGEVRGQIVPPITLPITTAGAQSLTVPMNSLQENAPISFTYTANPQQQLAPSLVTSCASATFTVFLDPTVSPSNITFSSIAITGLAALPQGATQQLQYVHIHGPCPTSTPCDTGVVYFICGNPGNACPSGTNPTIPSFTVNTAQTAATADGSLLLGLLQGILSGNNLYYVNFHTAA